MGALRLDDMAATAQLQEAQGVAQLGRKKWSLTGSTRVRLQSAQSMQWRPHRGSSDAIGSELLEHMSICQLQSNGLQAFGSRSIEDSSDISWHRRTFYIAFHISFPLKTRLSIESAEFDYSYYLESDLSKNHCQISIDCLRESSSELDGRDERSLVVLVVLDRLLRLGSDRSRLDLHLGVDLGCGSRGTESVNAVLHVRVLMPAEGGVSLDGQDGVAVRQNRHLVRVGLLIEDLEAWHGDNSCLEALLLQLCGGVPDDGNLGAGSNEGDVGVLDLLQYVTTLAGLLDARALELWQVLSGQSNDGRRLDGLDSNLVHGRDLVTVSRAHEVEVGDGSQGHGSLDGLVGWTVLSETNGVVGSDPDDTEV